MATDGKVNRWNSVSYAAVDERLLDTALLMPGASTAPFSARPGRRVNGAGLAVSVGGGPEAWTVTAGAGVIYDPTYSAQGAWRFEIPTLVTANMPARPGVGTSRIDRVVARIYDVDIAVGAVREVKIELVVGTAAASPTTPSPPALSFTLAVLTVPNTGTITVFSAPDRTVAAGGVLPVTTTAERDALVTASIAYQGLVVDNAQTGALERYNGTAWKTLQEVDDTGWQAVALNAGYTSSSTPRKPSVKKKGGRTTLEGTVVKTTAWTASTGHAIGTVPAGYRPPTGSVVSKPISGDSVAITTGSRVTIDDTGVVTVTIGTTAPGAGGSMHLVDIGWEMEVKV